MFYGITDLTTFVLGTIFIVLLPGPNSLYVTTVASKSGIRLGYQAAAGVFIGDVILMLLSSTGAASVLAASPTLFMGLKYVGAAYLAWVGLGLIRSATQQWAGFLPSALASSGDSGKHKPEPVTKTSRQLRSLTPFRTALAISLINPKSILFFVSFFIQFVDPQYPYPALSFLILGVILQIISMIYLTVLIVGGAHLSQAFARKKRLSSTLTGLVGLLFIGFGIRLATASLV